MKDSNVETGFVQTGFKDNRSKFLHKLIYDEVKQCLKPVEEDGREGLYTENPSVLDKYMRRDYSVHRDVFEITYMQISVP